MGIWGSLFGTAGGYGKGYKQQGGGLYSQYANAIEDAYGQNAYQTRVADYTEGLDAALANQGAGGYGNLMQRGFAPSSPDLYALTRALSLARHKAGTRQDMRTGKMSALQTLFGMWQGMGPVNYKAPTNGAIGAIAQAAGAFAGAQGAKGQGKPGQTAGPMADGLYSPAMPDITMPTGLNYNQGPSAQQPLQWWEQF